MRVLTPFLFACAASAGEEAKGVLPLTGLNLAGAEFGEPGGAYGTAYRYPSEAEIASIAKRGFTTIRLPFLWERLQPALEGPLDEAERDRIEAVVQAARSRGLVVVLDLHNFARWRGATIGSAAVPIRAFADVWTRLAGLHKGRDGVLFGLMNEPHDIRTEVWAEAAQGAVDAIRAAGACNRVLVPGNGWSGAHSWASSHYGTPNSRAMARIADPANKMSFEFHQYLDADFSGRNATCISPARAVATLAGATDWLAARRATGFLGEIGAGSNPNCLKGLDAMLAHLDAHPKQWIGWTAWAAGEWWPKDYPLLLEPRDGIDPPQLGVFERWRGKGHELARAALSSARCDKHPRPGRRG